MTNEKTASPTKLTDDELENAAGGFPGEMLDGGSDDDGDTAFPGEMLDGGGDSGTPLADFTVRARPTDLTLNKPKPTFTLKKPTFNFKS